MPTILLVAPIVKHPDQGDKLCTVILANLKSALHDQFVCGIRDESLRMKLFEDLSLDDDKAIDQP